jgi:NAD(P)-dependent dehydrogenase (short-subunit alcohol dehydrogenase family)
MSGLFSLIDRVAIVTGACGLLGREHSDVLAEAGSNIVVADLKMQACRELAEEIAHRRNVKVLPVEMDVSNKGSVEEMVRRAMEAFGRIDVLINNAALTVRGGSEEARGYFAPFEEYPLEMWEKALRVNLTGTFLCSQLIGREMAKQNRGVIVNICSTYGIVGPDQRIYSNARSPYDPTCFFNTPAAYSATKGAVLALTRYLATYWAGKNIRVNALTPGGVFDQHNDEFVRDYCYRTPLARMATPTDYRGAILFLASDASAYMTGSNLIVDGGWTAW